MSKTVIAMIITFLTCVLVFGGVFVIMNQEKWFGDAPSDGSGAATNAGGRPTLDPNAGEYVAPEVTKAPESGGIAIPGWGSITIPAGRTEVVVDFPNPEENAGLYYLTFELRIKETGEVLYASGLVSPGLHIQKINLSRALDAGTYPVVIHVQPYQMNEALTPTNNADMETNLIVVNP